MSNKKHWETTTVSPEATEALATLIGHKLRGGETIELVSDLGGGKTTFVRGLARGLGSHDRVSSPTFTISKVYKAKNLELHHFDFYRLNEGGMVAHELAEVAGDPQCITVVEWGEIVQDALPHERLTITIQNHGDDTRDITVVYPPTLEYCLSGVL